MAFGEDNHKKSGFEKLTLVVVVIMLLVTLGGLILPLISDFVPFLSY